MRTFRTLSLVFAATALCPIADAGWKLKQGKTQLQSMPQGGASEDFHSSYAPVVSGDGKQILFMSSVGPLTGHQDYPTAQILWKNRETGQISIVSTTKSGLPSTGQVSGPRISADGVYAVFSSLATDLVDGITIADVAGHYDVFRVHLPTGTIVRVSITHDFKEPNNSCSQADISADGRYVVFQTIASNMLPTAVASEKQLYRKDMHTGTLELVSQSTGGASGDGNSHLARITADGQQIAFYSFADNFGVTTNFGTECWVRDMQAGTTELVSMSKHGGPSQEGATHAVISGDGRYVAFSSGSDDMPGGAGKDGLSLYVRDRKKGKTVRVPINTKTSFTVQANGFSASRYVVFKRSTPTKIRSYIYDAKKKAVHAVDLSSKGKKGDDSTWEPSISANGKVVVFQSRATNFGADDDDFIDVFVRRWK